MKCLNIAFFFALLLTFFSCNKDYEVGQVTFIGFDKISKVELSPNSPQLIADGKAELKFSVKCYYLINDTTEIKMIMDRVPVDEIKITSSEQKTVTLKEGYTTTSNADSLYFTCTVGGKISKKVSVAITPAQEPQFEPVVIPVIFHAVYTDKTINSIQNFTPELLQAMLDRANKVFGAEIIHAPSDCPSGVTFKLDRINKVKVAPTENIYTYISNRLMTDPQKHLNIWVLNTVIWQLDIDYSAPKYTFGNPNDIKGLGLKKITSLEDIATIKPENVGFAMSFSDIYQMSSGANTRQFEYYLGRFYGLLPTYHYDEETNKFIDGDLDYCPDTHSYVSRNLTLEKTTFPISGDKNKRYFYDSFNIMDEYSSSTTISRDQVIRLRQVMKDCAYRQMKK